MTVSTRPLKKPVYLFDKFPLTNKSIFQNILGSFTNFYFLFLYHFMSSTH